jgi:hypothetical protein
MKRTIFVAGAAAAFLLASMTAGELKAQQPRTGTGSAFGGMGTGSAFGSSSFGSGSGFGGGQTGSPFGAGLQQGYGGLSQQGLGGQLGLQNRNLTQLLNQNQNRNVQTTQNNTILQNQVPIRLQVAVSRPQLATVAAAAPVQGKLRKIMDRPGVGTPTAMWEGDVLVLSGTVANESVRRTIEGIALLQPGVRTVRNETVVGPVAEPSGN